MHLSLVVHPYQQVLNLIPDPGFIHVLPVMLRWSLTSASFAKDTFNTLWKMHTESCLTNAMEMKFPSYFYRSLGPHHLTKPKAPSTFISPTFSIFPGHRFLREGFSLWSFIIFHRYVLPHPRRLAWPLYAWSAAEADSGDASSSLGGRWSGHAEDRTGVGASTGPIRIHGKRAGVLVLELRVSH